LPIPSEPGPFWQWTCHECGAVGYARTKSEAEDALSDHGQVEPHGATGEVKEPDEKTRDAPGVELGWFGPGHSYAAPVSPDSGSES
jgi:hypothetical protein